MLLNRFSALLFALILAPLNFVPTIYILDNSLYWIIFRTADFKYSLLCAGIVLIPHVLDDCVNIYISCARTSIGEMPSRILASFGMFALYAIQYAVICASPNAAGVSMTLLYFQVTLAMYFEIVSTYRYSRNRNLRFSFTMIICLIIFGVGIHSLTHILRGTWMYLWLCCSFLSFLFGLSVSLRLIFMEYKESKSSSIDSMNYFCYIVCMISLFVLVLGCILLRLISLYAVDGTSIYINGLTILSSLCSLPVFMLDGRIARYDAIKNEVC